MTRKFCIFNLLLVMLVFLFSIQVFAEELVIDDRAVDITETSSAFSIKTPKRLVLEKDSKTGEFKSNYKIEVSISNEADKEVSLIVRPRQNTFELTAENKKPIIAYVEQEETEFSTVLQPDLATGYATSGSVYTKESLSSAEWHGMFGFEIILQSAGTREEVRMATPSEATPSEAEEIIDEEIIEDELILDEEIIEDDITEATPSEATKEESNTAENTTEESTPSEATPEGNGLEENTNGLENNPNTNTNTDVDVGQVTTESDIDIGMQVDTEETTENTDVDIGESTTEEVIKEEVIKEEVITEEVTTEFTLIESNEELETTESNITVETTEDAEVATPSEANI